MLSKTIGNYRIVGELAKGGMGTVYRAHHLHLPREVVIKSIQLESFSASAQDVLKARFRREAFIQSQLDHPNIVRVLEFFKARDNYYLVMEYVAGVSLRELLDMQGKPAPKQAVYLFKQVLSALNYAHNFSFLDESGNRQTGIIHRDINPANLLLDGNGRVKITDFGTVKAAGTTRLTQFGFHPGTLEYMSPEQVRGIEIDTRSDIYNVGVAFYELLTGQLPFPLTEGGSDWDVRKGHIELSPPPMSKLNPDVPSDLAAIVMRALEKSPNNRYQSAWEFLKALNEFKPAAEFGKRKARGQARKFTDTNSVVVKHILKPDPNVFPQRMDNLFEQGDAVTIPVTTLEVFTGANQSDDQPQIARLSTNRSVTQSELASKTNSGLFKHLNPLIAKYNLPRRVVLQVAVLLVLVAACVTFLLSSGKPDLQIAMTNINQASLLGEAATMDNARDFERRENYDEAIMTYEAIFYRNSQSPEAQKEREGLTMKIMQLRTFQTLIEAGRTAERGARLATARQHYFEALQIKPDSELARTRLAEIDQKLTQPLR
ncbi:MAG: protein kinase domain-containing protein [Blastocatellia bacterium]